MNRAVPHIVLFDLYQGGHHLQYLEQLATYWVRQQLPGRLTITVPRAFLDRHPSLDAFVRGHADAGLQVAPIDSPVPVKEGDVSFAELVKNNRAHGHFLRAQVDTLQPDHTVLMYFDHVQFSLAFGLRFKQSTTLSGIYFRPSFHYGDFTSQAGQPVGLREKVQRARKRQSLALALRNPHLSHLFCLDPYVVPYIRPLQPQVEAVFLPDGFEPRPGAHPPGDTRRRWGIEAGRQVALFFGVINSRKGILQVLAALGHLSDAAQRQLGLMIAGPVPPHEQPAFQQALAQAQATTEVQFVTDLRFIPDAEIQDLVGAADLVMVTYQRHIGSSNVLIRAAAEGVPVLGSDYGLVGEQIRRHQLGLTVDTTDPAMLAEALQGFLAHPPDATFNAGAAHRFAQANTAAAYAGTLFRHIHPAYAPYAITPNNTQARS